MSTPDITLRGIRASLPSGYILGRVSPGVGQVELLKLSQLIAKSGVGSFPGTGGGSSGPGLPNKASFDAGGLLAPLELLGEWAFAESVTFDDTNTNTFFNSVLPATADCDLPLFVGASQIGHIHFPSGSVTGTLVIASNPYVLAAKTRLQLKAPASPDATLSDIYGLMVGTS